MRVHLVPAVLAATALAAASGCSSAPTTSEAPPVDHSQLVTTTDPATGPLGNVTWDVAYGEPASLDPIKAFNYPENTVVSNLCEGITQIQPDFTVKPGLAEKIDHPDATTYVYTMRQGVTFWDGKPMTMDDVIFSINRQLDPKEGSYWASDRLVGNMASVKQTGPWEMTIKLKQADVAFNGYLATPFGNVVEESFRKKAGDAFGTPQGGIMCTGPYKVGTWKKGDRLTLEANDNYWNADKRAKTKQVTFRFIVDSGALSSALTTGAVDGAYGVPLDSLNTLRESKDGRLILGKSLQIVAVIATGDGPLGDPKIRRALAMATDREAIAKVVYGGTATAARSVIPPDGWSYGNDIFTKALADLPDTKVDIEGAKKLVAETGAPTEPITIAYPAERHYYANILSEMANGARKLGITIEPKGVPSAKYGAFFSDSKARAGYGGFMTTNYEDIPDPWAFLTTMAVKGASQNFSNYYNPRVEQLLNQAQGTEDDDARATLVSQALKLWEADMPWIPIVAPAVRMFVSNKVTGMPASLSYLYYPWAADMGAASAQ